MGFLQLQTFLHLHMDFPKSFVGGNATDMIGIQCSEKIVIDLHLKIQNN